MSAIPKYVKAEKPFYETLGHDCRNYTAGIRRHMVPAGHQSSTRQLYDRRFKMGANRRYMYDFWRYLNIFIPDLDKA